MKSIIDQIPLNQPLISIVEHQDSLTNKLADSGEGSVWVTDQTSKLAKLYHQVTERLEKLETMLVYPPVDPKLAPNHITYAWPESLLSCGQAGGEGENPQTASLKSFKKTRSYPLPQNCQLLICPGKSLEKKQAIVFYLTLWERSTWKWK